MEGHNDSDVMWMRRCYDLSQRGRYGVSPNPMVGAVLVHDNNIIGEGWHQRWGQAHAEVLCFQSVWPEHEPLIPYSTLYCSLEPCSHFGKTPPCADLIIEKQVPRVVVGNLDPNPLVAGKGIEKLENAGIDCTTGVLEAEGLWLNRRFFTWITQQRPHITLKWAQSADGFLGYAGQETPISNERSRRLVHRRRAESDAVLVGAGTARTDDPQLDTRFFNAKTPVRVVLNGSGTLAPGLKMFQDGRPTWLFGPLRSDLPASVQQWDVPSTIDLADLMQRLRENKCASILVEGGAQILEQFIQAGLWDEILVIEGASSLGQGIPAPRVPAGACLREEFRLDTDRVRLFVGNRDKKFDRLRRQAPLFQKRIKE